MSKYIHISRILQEEILSGVYDKSKKLPTESELMSRFKVSRNTIRNSIRDLENKELVFIVRGSGIYIKNRINNTIPFNSLSFSPSNVNLSSMATKVLSFDLIKADGALSKKLNCTVETSLYCIKRIKYLNNKPFCFEESMFIKDIVLFLNFEIISKSIFSYLINELKLPIAFTDKVISSSTLDSDVASMLNNFEGDPCLTIESASYLSNGTIFNFSKSIFNYKAAKFSLTTKIQ